MDFPKGTEHLKPYVETYQKQIFGHILHGVNAPVDARRETPMFAAIYLFNGMSEQFEKMLTLMEKYYGKNGYAIILSIVLKNDMGFDHVKRFWSERGVGLSQSVFASFEDCDEKYIRYFLEDSKFLRLSKEGLKDQFVINSIKKYGKRLITIGFEYPKFSKILAIAYASTGDDIFLTSEAKDIFLF